MKMSSKQAVKVINGTLCAIVALGAVSCFLTGQWVAGISLCSSAIVLGLFE
jgi:hypothetical protein